MYKKLKCALKIWCKYQRKMRQMFFHGGGYAENRRLFKGGFLKNRRLMTMGRRGCQKSRKIDDVFYECRLIQNVLQYQFGKRLRLSTCGKASGSALIEF